MILREEGDPTGQKWDENSLRQWEEVENGGQAWTGRPSAYRCSRILVDPNALESFKPSGPDDARPLKANLNQPGPHASGHVGSHLRVHKTIRTAVALNQPPAAIPLRTRQTSLSSGPLRVIPLLFGQV